MKVKLIQPVKDGDYDYLWKFVTIPFLYKLLE